MSRVIVTEVYFPLLCNRRARLSILHSIGKDIGCPENFFVQEEKPDVQYPPLSKCGKMHILDNRFGGGIA